MVSTAKCTLFGPSGPLNAKPGPSMPHREAMMMTSRPKPIANVVVDKYINCTSQDGFSLSMERPP